MRSTRASVSVEFVAGSLLLVTMIVGGLDLYAIIDARSLGSRAADTMSNYVALESAPKTSLLNDLAKFSYKNEIAVPSKAAFVVSAVSLSDAKDAKAVVEWNHKFAVGPDGTPPPSTLTDSCAKIGASKGSTADVPDALAMKAGEKVVVVEVCVKLLPRAFLSGGFLPAGMFPSTFYQYRILPVRGDLLPQEPT